MMKKIMVVAVLLSSMSLFAEEITVTDSEIVAAMDKGICKNICKEICDTKYCRIINGEEVCDESCETICEWACE